MGVEIERKFLVRNEKWKSDINNKIEIKQGYLNSVKERTVRIRVKGEDGFITIKGKNNNATRKEFEYKIPFLDAEEMLLMCEMPIIEKIRYELVYMGKLWEIDEFDGENKGLIVAEIELNSEAEKFDKPEWLGAEVTQDPRYYNSSLISYPFNQWNK